MEYKYKIDGDVAMIYITNRKKEIFEVLVDTEDLERVINFHYSWYIAYHKSINAYYVKSTVYCGTVDGKHKSKPQFLHRYILEDKITDNDYIDHINNNELDNRKCNLRITNNSLNLRNRTGKNKNNKSGYRNVSMIKGRYVVQLQIDGKGVILGNFTDVDEAGKFAKEMREKYYGEFAGNS
jgi:hypothetical protein